MVIARTRLIIGGLIVNLVDVCRDRAEELKVEGVVPINIQSNQSYKPEIQNYLPKTEMCPSPTNLGFYSYFSFF